jgi:succinylglutamic semialdehyde dehydrogenase
MTSLYIDGAWVKGGGPVFSSIDPSNNTVIWEGNEATADQVRAAVAAARDAFFDWSVTSFDDRVALAREYARILGEKKQELGELIAKDAGKAMWDALGEAGAMINKVEISVQAYEERTGYKENQNGAVIAKLGHRPHGVMAVFGPYNFPGHLPNGHIVPALIAGNTIVFKPSEITPAVAELMVKCWEEAGLPKGVLNLVQGGRDVGSALVAADEIDGLLFTGSAKTGAIISRELVDRPNVIQALELGGNNPLIVGNVSDMRSAAIMALQSAFITSGQRCTCARRLIVPEGDVGDAFIDAFLEAMDGITVGAWSDDEMPYMGPVVSAHAADLVLKAQQSLIDMGGKVVRKVKRLDRGDAYLSAGLIDVTGVENRPDEEVFGPMLQLIRVPDLSTALEEANNTRYGLAAGLLSDDKAEFDYFFPRIRAGIVNWNQQTTGAASTAPFGGVGLSGNHRPSAYYAADYCSYAVATMEQSEGKATGVAVPQGLKIADK